ncbi:MAG: polyprenyl synthetase family protein [Polyangiaceae bacterium]
MSAQPETFPTPAALPRRRDEPESGPGLRAPELVDLVTCPDLSEVEARMLALAGPTDRAGRMAREHLATGGKRLRARLALAAATALGAPRDAAIAWATAVELLHNATLVHDDIQDGDTARRGKPTVWARHGVAQGINVGDLFLMLPFLALAEIPGDARAELSPILAAHAVQTVRGQIDELELLDREALDDDAYVGAIVGKTGALLALPVVGAAVLSGRSLGQARRLGEAFMPLGLLFQLQDDLLDLYGDKGRQRPGCDLYEGKVSALVVAHLARRPADRAWLLDLLRRPRDQTPEAEVRRAIAAFADSSAVDDVLARIRRLAATPDQDLALAEEPSLRLIASHIATLAVAPIRHLFEDLRA